MSARALWRAGQGARGVRHRSVRSVWSALAWGALALWCCWLLVLPAHAAMPLANTRISNQAVARYVDSAGVEHTVQSNVVVSTVAQVGGMRLRGSESAAGLPGTRVSLAHALTNLGNGADSFLLRVKDASATLAFADIALYADDGSGNHVGRRALCSAAQGNPCDGTGVRVTVQAGEVYRFLVVYTLPLQGGGTGLAEADVTAEPAEVDTPFYATYQSKLETVHNAVAVTQGAVFKVVKAFAAPAIAPALGRWPGAVSEGSRSVDGCPVQWSDSLLDGQRDCVYTVVTLTYTNSGAIAGDLRLQEILPAGWRHVQGSAMWSGMMQSALAEHDFTSPQGGGNAQIHFSVETQGLQQAVRAHLPQVPAGAQGTVSFVVLIDNSAGPGVEDSILSGAYYSTHCAASTTTAALDACLDPAASGIVHGLTPTAPLAYRVETVRAAWLEAVDAASAGVSAGPAPGRGSDLTLEQTLAGGQARFVYRLRNAGDVPERYTIGFQAQPGASPFPVGTRMDLLPDYVTPLFDSEGQYQTVTVPPGGEILLTVLVRPPVVQRAVSGPFQVRMVVRTNGTVAPPQGENATTRVAVLQVNRIVGALADLTASTGGGTADSDTPDGASGDCIAGRNCDYGRGSGDLPTLVKPGVPGQTVVFPVYLQNNDFQEQAYNLLAGLPPGWEVQWLDGADASCGSPALSLPVVIGAGQQRAMALCVRVPANAAIGLQNFRLSAEALGEGSAGRREGDHMQYAVRVVEPEQAAAFALQLSKVSQSLSAGAAHLQPLRLINPSAKPCATDGGFDVQARIETENGGAPWPVSVHHDSNRDGILDVGDIRLGASGAPVGNLNDVVVGTPGAVSPLAAGQAVYLLVHTEVPDHVVVGTNAVLVIEVQDRSRAACAAQTARVVLHTEQGRLHLTQKQVVDPQCRGVSALQEASGDHPVAVEPGQCLVYQIEFANRGGQPVRDVQIHGPVPAHTSISPLPPNGVLSVCEVFPAAGEEWARNEVGIDGRTSSVLCGSAGNSLAPHGVARLIYSVRVDD